MNSLQSTLEFFVIITAELLVLFLGISAIVAFVLLHIPQEKLRAWLSRKGIGGNILGAFVGALTPFCACSTIPMTVGLLHAGAPFGAVMSFVIASPLLNPIILAMIATMLGLEACIIYFVITFSASVLFGLVVHKGGFASQIKAVRLKQGCCSAEDPAKPEGFGAKVRYSFRSAWNDLTPVIPFLLIGVGLGAAIYGFVPEDFVVKLAGEGNPFAVPMAAIIGIPLYIRAETAIPIGLALADKGMSVGAVMALVIGGSGMAIPEMSMLASIFRKKLVGALVAAIFLTAVVGGLSFNALIDTDDIREQGIEHINDQLIEGMSHEQEAPQE